MKATITTDGKRIIADFGYQKGQKVWARKVPGARALWDKTGPEDRFLGWGYPLTMDTCWTFRRVFGEDLRVSGELASWARSELARRDQLELFRDEDAATAAQHLDLVREKTPDLFLALSSRPYQLTGAAFLRAGNGGLLGDQPGLGKTLQTIAVLVQESSHRILVSCPRTAKRTVWERELQRWAPHMLVFVAEGSQAQREKIFAAFEEAASRSFSGGHPCVLVINPEMLRGEKKYVEKVIHHRDGSESTERKNILTPKFPWLFERFWDAIVMDESHNVLATTKNTMSKNISQWRLGAMNIRRKIRPEGLAIALSGTPARSKVERFWGTLNWLRPDVFGSFWQFAETHFEVDTNGWGRTIGTENEHGRKVAVPLDEEAFDRALRPYYLVRDKATAAPDLPPITYAGTPPAGNPDGPSYVWVDMETKQAAAYRQMKELAEADLDSGRITATGVLAEITRLRQFANAYGHLSHGRTMIPEVPSAKLEWILQFLQEREGSAGKVVIASRFTEMVELIARTIRAEKGLSAEVLTLTGATSDRDRARLVERFQNEDDPCRVVVINAKAGGEAITLDRADDMIIVDPGWTSDEDEQLESRIHRVSRIHAVTVYRLAATGTVDEWMATLTDEQREIVQSAKPEALHIMKEAVG